MEPHPHELRAFWVEGVFLILGLFGLGVLISGIPYISPIPDTSYGFRGFRGLSLKDVLRVPFHPHSFPNRFQGASGTSNESQLAVPTESGGVEAQSMQHKLSNEIESAPNHYLCDRYWELIE
eukprot:4916301-Amphidinium_carterae.1